MRKTQSIMLSMDGKNSLNYWWKAKNPFRVIVNWILLCKANYIPSLAIKRFLWRLTGCKVGKNVAIAMGVQLDFFYPEKVTIKDNVIIGYKTTILAHEFIQKELRVGNVVIEENVLVGANCTILPGITIGKNATISAMSLINKDVSANAFVGGIPVQELKHASDIP